MKVAFDLTAVSSGHRFRGIGSYTSSLKLALEEAEPPFKIEFVKKGRLDGNYDLIHYPYFDFFFHTLPKNPRSKVVLTIHDAIPLVFPQHFPVGIKGNINFFLQKLALRKVAYVCTDSQTSASDIAEKLSVPKQKIGVVYLAPGSNFRPLEVQTLKKVKSKYKLPDEFCLYVGDVNWNKNVIGLLEAVDKTRLPLVMVGAGFTQSSKEIEAVDSFIAKNHLEPCILKTGFVPDGDLVAIYNLARATVLPSFYEGFGLPVLESMACGTPVVCSDNSSLSEITNETVATYCDPADPGDIGDKMISVFNMDKKRRRALEDKLTKHACAYTWQKVAKETIDIYIKALSQK